MDANQTSFHLLFGREDWSRAFLEDGATTLGEVWRAEEEDASPPGGPALAARAGWVDPHTQEWMLRPRLARFVPSPGDRPVRLEDRRGAARDRYGNWYEVSADRSQVLVRSVGSDRVTVFWPVPPAAASAAVPGDFVTEQAGAVLGECALTGLVITRDHYLVALSTVEARTEILIFDLFSGGPPWRLCWPADVPLEPWDLAPREPGGFWLLDRAGGRLWEFNTYFQVVRPPWVETPEGAEPDFGAVADDGMTPRPPCGAEPGSTCCAVSRVTLNHALELEEADPIAVEPLPGGGALILDRGVSFGAVAAYRGFLRCGGDTLAEILDVIDARPQEDWVLVPHDFAVLTQPSADMAWDTALRPPFLLVADQAGNQAFCFELSVSETGEPHLQATTQFVPMRLFGGRALLAVGGAAYYDAVGRFVPLVVQERPRFEQEAVLWSAPLDGAAPDCVWHRLLLEACRPSDTRILVATRATDANGAELATPDGRVAVMTALLQEAWNEEPEPVLRSSGCEIPWLRAEAVGDRPTWELLFQRARGRYLQVRLTLQGDGRRSPRVRAVRCYAPRFSYLTHYLPGCYREDATSASFLERFLANQEGLVTALEDRIQALGALCDPTAAPAEFLDWLGRWYAVYLDPGWPPIRKRLFLRHALTFFQWRGTARGLRTALRLAFDECLTDDLFTEEGDLGAAAQRYRVVEDFRTRLLPVERAASRPFCPGVEESADPAWWQPADGLEALQRRWRVFTGDATASFPMRRPAEAAAGSGWESFSRDNLGFVPVTDAADTTAWQRFLAGRYRSFAAAATAWRGVFAEEWVSFAEVVLPEFWPADPSALDDWVVFQRYVRPMRAAAHRFGVALPVRPQQAHDAEKLRVQLHLADRLIALEKPAHTAYRVQLYWAMFRVGEARLGRDTQLGQGSRLPELLPPLVLGEGALAESRLAPRPADWASERWQLGRNVLRHVPRKPGPPVSSPL